MTDPIDRLAEIFQKFPGIGPRQAQRFVAYLLRTSAASRRDLADAIQGLASGVKQCGECYRFFGGVEKVCGICANPQRDPGTLALVASDADLGALESSGTFRGHYFVLGGTISLASEKMTGLRVKQLLDSLPRRIEKGLTEIIIAFPANPEGDATATRMKEEIIAHEKGLRVTTLGRGLSTGSELEYADPETIKSALESRR